MGKQKLFEKKYSQDFSRFDVSYKLTNPISATKSKPFIFNKPVHGGGGTRWLEDKAWVSGGTDLILGQSQDLLYLACPVGPGSPSLGASEPRSLGAGSLLETARGIKSSLALSWQKPGLPSHRVWKCGLFLFLCGRPEDAYPF